MIYRFPCVDVLLDITKIIHMKDFGAGDEDWSCWVLSRASQEYFCNTGGMAKQPFYPISAKGRESWSIGLDRLPLRSCCPIIHVR